jgi:hypothetical protein
MVTDFLLVIVEVDFSLDGAKFTRTYGSKRPQSRGFPRLFFYASKVESRLTQHHRVRLIKQAPIQVTACEVAPMPILVQTCQDTTSAGHADGSRIVMIQESHTIVGELIEIRSDDILISVTSDRLNRLVVAQKKNDVWSLGDSVGCLRRS